MKAIIWRRSVYEKRTCPLCGEPLRDENGDPLGSVLFDTASERFHCPRCGLFVARLEDYDGPVPQGRQGGAWKGGTHGPA